MKKLLLILFTSILVLSVAGCGSKKGQDATEGEGTNLTVVGFSQVGAESDWRSENTKSMKTSLSVENGYELIFEDAQQKQANQITAIRKFIQQDVDYIVLAPVTATGWNTVLGEAKEAGIPVIIVDRMIDVSSEDLFACFVGSDFELEAKKVTSWMFTFFREIGFRNSDVKIVNIQGNLGASAQIGRTKGLEDACAKYGWTLLDEVPGEFTQAKGREVMENFLEKYPDLNVVYCENDNEALGAIEAIEAAGRTVGSDIAAGEIMIVSFDGVGETAKQFAMEGKIACIGECNPLHGPRVNVLIGMFEYGLKPEKICFVDESIFSSYEGIDHVSVDGKNYPVTILTKDE